MMAADLFIKMIHKMNCKDAIEEKEAVNGPFKNELFHRWPSELTKL